MDITRYYIVKPKTCFFFKTIRDSLSDGKGADEETQRKHIPEWMDSELKAAAHNDRIARGDVSVIVRKALEALIDHVKESGYIPEGFPFARIIR